MARHKLPARSESRQRKVPVSCCGRSRAGISADQQKQRPNGDLQARVRIGQVKLVTSGWWRYCHSPSAGCSVLRLMSGWCVLVVHLHLTRTRVTVKDKRGQQAKPKPEPASPATARSFQCQSGTFGLSRLQLPACSSNVLLCTEIGLLASMSLASRTPDAGWLVGSILLQTKTDDSDEYIPTPTPLERRQSQRRITNECRLSGRQVDQKRLCA